MKPLRRLASGRASPVVLFALLWALPEVAWGLPREEESSPLEDSALEFRLEFTNDDLSGSTYPDDLYSFGGSLALSGKRFGLRLEERGFTDKLGETRFDETYLAASGRFLLPSGTLFGGWHGEASLGVLRVGRGLAGASVQNELHRWIGDELIEADYVAANDIHPHLGLVASGPIVGLQEMKGWLQVETSPGFRTTVALGLQRAGPQVGLFRFEGVLGARWTQTQLNALRPWVEELAPTATLTTHYRQRYRLTWSYNAYGTGDLHWHFGFATPLRRRTAAPAE